MLLSDRAIQLGTNDAINNMYNFNFYEAEKDFKWLTVKYPNHPIGHFLLGLNEWWKIVPDLKVTRYDETCHEYMDLAIKKAEDLYDEDSRDKEAAFFLAVASALGAAAGAGGRRHAAGLPANVAAIAAGAEVAIGTIYNYYRNKGDLLVAIVSGVVLTAAPVDAEPRPLTAIWLVRWLRTAWAGSTTPAFAGAAETMAPVAWAPLLAPPDVLT